MLREIAQYTASLLGRSAYQAPPSWSDRYDLDSPGVQTMLERYGGQLQLPTQPQTRWYLVQLEQAEYDAAAGKLEIAGKLMAAARSDGVFCGVLSTRTGGLVRLPKRFRGDPDIVAALELGNTNTSGEVRSVFDEMCPAAELAALAADGVLLGVGVGQLIPVEGRDYPVFVRLDPQFLLYSWADNTWYYRSVAGALRITPGDGRWVLHTPGGRNAPWNGGIWRAIGRAYIRKEYAALHKDNWEGKLANPARVATAPAGATDEMTQSWFRAVMAWGVNTVFGMKPGYEVKLIESNGRGWESFNKTIEAQNNEMIICVAGQTVTVDGGAGFANADIHKSIRADLIKDTAEGLAYSVNTQIIPAFVAARFGGDAIDDKPCVVEWDVTPPKDRNAEASAYVSVAAAVKQLTEALGGHELRPNVEALCSYFSVPLAAPEPEATADQLAAEKAQDTALNGSQIESLLLVISQIATGQLPRDTGLEIIKTAFNIDHEEADAMLGSVGRGFVPEPLEDDEPALDDVQGAEVIDITEAA